MSTHETESYMESGMDERKRDLETMKAQNRSQLETGESRVKSG
jgi:hypothetical protein